MFRFLYLFIWSTLGQDNFPSPRELLNPALRLQNSEFQLDSFDRLQANVKTMRKRKKQGEGPRVGRQDGDGTTRPPTNSIPPTQGPDPEQCNVQSKPESPPIPSRFDTFFQNVKHDYTYSDISTAAPSRFSDMGYLFFGYDLYKGNLLSYGFDPGFRHPLFDHGKIEDYKTSFDGRHTQPPGTTALPAQACSATFRQTLIETVEDLQERQGSVYTEQHGFSFDGSELADAIPEALTKNPKVAAIVGAVKTLKAAHSSMNNDEYKSEMASAMREGSTTIIAEAECNVYQAKLNHQAPPPLLPEVKAWFLGMLDIQQKGEKEKLRGEIIKFLDYYGTHIVAELNFGARYMYNFTLTSKDEAELKDTFKSFRNAVSSELNFLGFGTSSQRENNENAETSKKASTFKQTVETTVKSIGAALPALKDDDKTPDAQEWAKSSFENPVPVKITLVGIEHLLNEQFLGEGFIEESACKNGIKKDVIQKQFEDLRDEFLRVLPRKAITVCERTVKHCESEKLKGEELKSIKKLFECAEVAVQFQNNDKDGKYSGLLDVLTTGATDEEKRCLEKTKTIEKLTTAFDAINEHIGLNLYDLLGSGQLRGGLFSLITTVADDSKAGNFLNLIGIETNPAIPNRCTTYLNKFLKGDVGALFRGFFDGLKSFFVEDSPAEEKAMEECTKIAKDIEKKKMLWDKYGMKILEALTPEKLAADCFQKTKCCRATQLKACTKIAGSKKSYAEVLSKRGGIPEDDLMLFPESDDIEERIKEELNKAINTPSMTPCKRCEDNPKDEGPDECKAENDDDDDNEDDEDTSWTDDDQSSSLNPCAKNSRPVDCCSLDPRQFGKDVEGAICDNCKNCTCTEIDCREDTDEDRRAIAKLCIGKQRGDLVFGLLPSHGLGESTCPGYGPRRRARKQRSVVGFHSGGIIA